MSKEFSIEEQFDIINAFHKGEEVWYKPLRIDSLEGWKRCSTRHQFNFDYNSYVIGKPELLSDIINKIKDPSDALVHAIKELMKNKKYVGVYDELILYESAIVKLWDLAVGYGQTHKSAEAIKINPLLCLH